MKQKKFLGLISTLILVTTSVFTLALPASATPNAPTILMAAGGNTSATIQVAAAGSGPVPTSYEVSASPGSSTCTIIVPNNACNLESLTNGTKYTVTVIAVRDGNNSSPATTTTSPMEASYTLSVTDDLVDAPGECQTFTTNAPGTVLATWSGNDGVIGEVGSLSGYSLCPDWSWYGIIDTALNLTLTLWHSGTPISSGALLSTVQETYTPFASATGLYSPFSGDDYSFISEPTSSSLSEGETLSFIVDAPGDQWSAIFIDETYWGSGPVNTIPSIDWVEFGNCNNRVLTLRIYGDDAVEFPSWLDDYLTSVDVTFIRSNSTSCSRGSVSNESASKLLNYFVVEGFKPKNSYLNKTMRSFIRAELSKAFNFERLECTGTVRGKKWTSQKEQLAVSRARVACDYAQSVYPSAEVELKIRLIKKPKQNPLTVRIRVYS